PVKCVVVTGDIFEGTVPFSPKLLDAAVGFFDLLLCEINKNQADQPLQKKDFIFVPGNHDIIRTDDANEKWMKYKSFINTFYQCWPDVYNKESFYLIQAYHDYKIAFIGFNSCRIEKKAIFDRNVISAIESSVSADRLCAAGIDKNALIGVLTDESADEYIDYGEIAMADITAASREIKKLDGYNIIAFFHHHFYLFPEIAHKIGDSGLIRNHTTVTQYLKQMNVKTILHGHKHYDLERPFITEDYYKTTDSIIDVFAGGSVGTARKDYHTFSIIDFYPRSEAVKIIQKKFIYKEEALDVVSKQIPPQNITTKILRLLELLKTVNPDASQKYTDTAEQIFKTYPTCNQVILWLNEAITGFTDVFKLIEKDDRNILFMLYAVQLRALYTVTRNSGDKEYMESSLLLLKKLYVGCVHSDQFDLTPDEFHALLKIRRLQDVAKACDKYLNRAKNLLSHQYLAFTMVGVFFTDLYMVLTQYADEFYNDTIKYKVNIKLEENRFHQNVPAPRIVIHSDVDRRSAYIQMLCNEATAHKMAVLFVKEFDLLINKYEDYFKIIGLKLYYLLPKINKDNLKDTLDNYNFEAYIPTLLPLLTGDNIYPSKVVFARELIQNSIDAIAVRRAKVSEDIDETIHIEMGVDKNNRRYFLIADCGTGMDRYKIERYFTSIGRSFYSGDEYSDLKISYKPISNFGIGFLSSFMVCQEIDVKTKYYLADSEGLTLHIPNYDGCFFIDKDDGLPVGTELKLYLNQDFKNSDIVQYIKNVMQDIRFDIRIKSTEPGGAECSEYIPKRAIRKKHGAGDLRYFVPLSDDGAIIDLDYSCVIDDDAVNEYDYGVLIKYGRKEKPQQVILNAGILVQKASLSDFFNFGDRIESRLIIRNEMRGDRNNSAVVVNFPANWTQLDVSRENCGGYSDFAQTINNFDENRIGASIARVLYNQIQGSIEYFRIHKINTPLLSIQRIVSIAIQFCNRKQSEIGAKLRLLYYRLYITVTDKGFLFEVKNNVQIKRDTRFLTINEDSVAEFMQIYPKLKKHHFNEVKQMKLLNESRIILEKRRLRESDIYEYEFDDVYRIYDHISGIGDLSRSEISKLLSVDKFAESGHANIDILLCMYAISLSDFLVEGLQDKKKRKTLAKRVESTSVFQLIQMAMLQHLTVPQFVSYDNSIFISFDKLIQFVDSDTGKK
ncbi:MAG: ATP-binding protein, partial [Oscillospiraceae bacterium]|nr:ATP-binding protein [Oscillospiraceae bacterium]